MATPISQAAEEIQGAIAGWQPENIEDLRGMMTDVGALVRALSGGVETIAAKCRDELPVHNSITEHIEQIIPALNGIADHADELPGLFEKLHEHDVERVDNPRPGEEIMDYQANK